MKSQSRLLESQKQTQIHVRILSHSVVSNFVIQWTVTLRASLSKVFCRQECCSGLPFLPLRDPPDPGIKPMSPVSPALEGGIFFTIEPLGKSQAQLRFPTSLKQDKKHMRPEISKVKNLYALCGNFLKRWEYQTTLPDS